MRVFVGIIDNERLLALLLAAVLAAAAIVECDPAPARASRAEPLVPADHWDPPTQLWLSRAMVGEAGWTSEADHVAIAYVLRRRWIAMTDRWPRLRFKQVILRYAKALGGGRRELTRRQTWVRGLAPGGLEPPGWPRTASWERHRPLWRAALRRAGDWRRGWLPDPCRGQARHWGGEIDVPGEGLEEVDCGTTKNTFYRLRSTPGVLGD